MARKKKAHAKAPKASNRLEVNASGVHGRGVFAIKSIPRRAQIIEYKGKRLLWENVPDDCDDGHTFYFGLYNGKDVIDPEIGGNEARWINHSCEPNCEAVEESGRVFIYALRDLHPGEELFYDYALQVEEPRTKEDEKDSECHCASAKCRGTMIEPN